MLLVSSSSQLSEMRMAESSSASVQALPLATIEQEQNPRCSGRLPVHSGSPTGSKATCIWSTEAHGKDASMLRVLGWTVGLVLLVIGAWAGFWAWLVFSAPMSPTEPNSWLLPPKPANHGKRLRSDRAPTRWAGASLQPHR
jgi:hypothetical protein